MKHPNGFDISTLSAAKLAMMFNAVTSGAPVKKFESTPRALERTLAELAAVGVSPIEAAYRAGLAQRPAAGLPAPERAPGAFEAVNLVTGQVVPLRSLHDPLRRVETAYAPVPLRPLGHPLRRQAGTRVVEAAQREQSAAAAPAARTDGPARGNKTLPQVLEALRRPGGATLAELTVAAGWRAPFEVANLRVASKKLGFAFADDGAAGIGRRYRIAS